MPTSSMRKSSQTSWENKFASAVTRNQDPVHSDEQDLEGFTPSLQDPVVGRGLLPDYGPPNRATSPTLLHKLAAPEPPRPFDLCFTEKPVQPRATRVMSNRYPPASRAVLAPGRRGRQPQWANQLWASAAGRDCLDHGRSMHPVELYSALTPGVGCRPFVPSPPGQEVPVGSKLRQMYAVTACGHQLVRRRACRAGSPPFAHSLNLLAAIPTRRLSCSRNLFALATVRTACAAGINRKLLT